MLSCPRVIESEFVGAGSFLFLEDFLEVGAIKCNSLVFEIFKVVFVECVAELVLTVFAVSGAGLSIRLVVFLIFLFFLFEDFFFDDDVVEDDDETLLASTKLW